MLQAFLLKARAFEIQSQAGARARVGRVYGPGPAQALRARQPGLSGFGPHWAGPCKPLVCWGYQSRPFATRQRSVWRFGLSGPLDVCRPGAGHTTRKASCYMAWRWGVSATQWAEILSAFSVDHDITYRDIFSPFLSRSSESLRSATRYRRGTTSETGQELRLGSLSRAGE